VCVREREREPSLTEKVSRHVTTQLSAGDMDGDNKKRLTEEQTHTPKIGEARAEIVVRLQTMKVADATRRHQKFAMHICP